MEELYEQEILDQDDLQINNRIVLHKKVLELIEKMIDQDHERRPTADVVYNKLIRFRQFLRDPS
jgi:hypothetical protein